MAEFNSWHCRAVLARHFLFASLDEGALDSILAVATQRKVRGGETIFQKGDLGYTMMAVLKGRVRISVFSQNGEEITLNLIGPSEFFGELALLDRKERSANATAAVETDLLVVDRRDFLPLLEQNPKTAIKLLEVLCQRVRETSELIETIAFLDTNARLAKLLLRLADHYGEKVDQGVLINIQMSQDDLAKLIAATRENVNRNLSLWHREGLVVMNYRQIIIRDPERLLILAEVQTTLQ